MTTYLKLYIIGGILSVSAIANAQPPAYIYEGGVGGGYSGLEVSVSNNFLYKGGTSDGYAQLKYNSTNTLLYLGGIQDGYSTVDYQSNDNFFYQGGESDGYAQSTDIHEGVTFYEGGIGQGFDKEIYCQEFIWTGAVGEGWNVADNWNYGIIPNISRPVVIPSAVPNFPNVNAGILAIGKNPNEGAFVCKSIWIQTGGELYTRINNFVENYGDIIVDGTMRVRNSAYNAFQNFSGGRIRISNMGNLTIKP